jgi:hypothetical protein
MRQPFSFQHTRSTGQNHRAEIRRTAEPRSKLKQDQPGSAAHRYVVSKPRVNALMALRSIQSTIPAPSPRFQLLSHLVVI